MYCHYHFRCHYLLHRRFLLWNFRYFLYRKNYSSYGQALYPHSPNSGSQKVPHCYFRYRKSPENPYFPQYLHYLQYRSFHYLLHYRIPVSSAEVPAGHFRCLFRYYSCSHRLYLFLLHHRLYSHIPQTYNCSEFFQIYRD